MKHSPISIENMKSQLLSFSWWRTANISAISVREGDNQTYSFLYSLSIGNKVFQKKKKKKSVKASSFLVFVVFKNYHFLSLQKEASRSKTTFDSSHWNKRDNDIFPYIFILKKWSLLKENDVIFRELQFFFLLWCSQPHFFSGHFI